MNQNSQGTAPNLESNSHLSLKIFGVGGAGGNAVNFLASGELSAATLVAVNTDAQALAASVVPHQLQLGAKLLRGLGTGGEPELAWAAAEKDIDSLRQHCVGTDVVMIIAGLGGGTGTGASPVLARVAREAGALVIAFAILPFACEGTRRLRQAEAGLEQLKSVAHAVICLPNQRLVKLVDENTSVVDTFKRANELLAQAVVCFWRLLTRPALLHVGLPELRQLFDSTHSDGCFVAAHGQGPNRGVETVDALLTSPLLESGKTFAEAKTILLSIVGGPSLTLSEVNRVVERMQQQGEQPQITLGAAIDPGLGDRIEICGLIFPPAPPIEPKPSPTLIAARFKLPANPQRAEAANSALEVPDLPMESLSTPGPRPPARLVPPAPELTYERAEQLMRRQTGSVSRSRQMAAKLLQGQLPLEIVSKGRFEKSSPTIHHGEDLDLPTFIRRRVPLN